jgi:hypothetical protein
MAFGLVICIYHEEVGGLLLVCVVVLVHNYAWKVSGS